jgi:hypothetical protein
MRYKELENSGIEAVQMLRKTKLALGFPFMINSYLLPSDQCFLEYPDGSIKIVSISKIENDFKVIEVLDKEKNETIRKKYRLF